MPCHAVRLGRFVRCRRLVLVISGSITEVTSENVPESESMMWKIIKTSRREPLVLLLSPLRTKGRKIRFFGSGRLTRWADGMGSVESTESTSVVGPILITFKLVIVGSIVQIKEISHVHNWSIICAHRCSGSDSVWDTSG